MSPSYFRTMKIPLKKGRYLEERDTQNAPWAVIISETLANRYFPNEDPIGQQILLRWELRARHRGEPELSPARGITLRVLRPSPVIMTKLSTIFLREAIDRGYGHAEGIALMGI